MVYKRKGKSRRRYGRKRGKWRQQKLAVGTVQKIARQIAQKEDRKNIRKYVHSTYVKATAFSNWPTANYKRALPALANWLSFTGSSQDLQIKTQIITNIADNIITPEMKLLDAAEQSEVELRLHGVETFGMVCNTSLRPMRFEARLLWIPNLNKYTQASIDYLMPRFTNFFRSGRGTGNLLFQGYARRGLGALDATGIPTKFTTLARKVVHVKAQDWTASLTGASAGEFSAQAPLVFRRFSLRKYFKVPKKAFCRGDDSPNDILSNGNIVLVYWNDLPGASTCSVLMTSNLQYSLKSNMNDDVGS